jgi:hypothetical protein
MASGWDVPLVGQHWFCVVHSQLAVAAVEIGAGQFPPDGSSGERQKLSERHNDSRVSQWAGVSLARAITSSEHTTQRAHSNISGVDDRNSRKRYVRPDD